MTGFVVVADGAGRSRQTPVFYLSDFKRAVEWLGLKRDYGLDVDSLKVPFAIVAAMKLGGTGGYFVTSPETLTGTTVAAWRLTPAGDPAWRPFRIMDATPLAAD